MSYYYKYRRPYHYRRRYTKGDDPFNLIGGLIVIGAVVFILKIPMAVWGNLLGIILVALIGVAIVMMLIRITRRISFKHGGVVSEETISITNSEKHGCKCYMEELTDGEREVAHILADGLNYKDYFIFNNIIIPSDINGSSQIDHLVLSRFGIFVIENKDYKGWIFGDKDEDEWTQSLPGGKNKFSFENPIHQNWSHIMSLRKVMPFVSESAFQSIVVFTGKCEIKTEPIYNVIRTDKIVEYINKYDGCLLSESELHLAIGKLTYLCQTLDISPEQHVENLRLNH